MKWIVIFWAGPLVLLFGWYGLSYYDINFGLVFFSRQLHDLVFAVYGDILGIPPETIPPLVLKAIIVDTILLAGIVWLKRNGKTLSGLIRGLFNRQDKETGNPFVADELAEAATTVSDVRPAARL